MDAYSLYTSATCPLAQDDIRHFVYFARDREAIKSHPFLSKHEHTYRVPLGIAVQDGNYIGQTNTDQVLHDRKNIVPLLHGFAKDFLKVSYMFWVDQEPYFEQDVLPCLRPE